MKWYKISVSTLRQSEDLVSDCFFNVGSEGVNVIDSKDIKDILSSDVIWDYVDEHLLTDSNIVIVEGFCEDDKLLDFISNLELELNELKKNAINLGSLEITTSPIENDDWSSEWRKYYKPIPCGHITVVPEWIKYSSSEDEIIIRINPGAAFGTGEHETTRMCLEFISDFNVAKKTVLDVGTGSGILAIAAKKCGAEPVYASDIDDEAIKSAYENAVLNKVDIPFTVGDLLTNSNIVADYVIANITADILIRLGSDIGKHLAQNGIIILSGIIHKRANDVLRAYDDYGYTVCGQKIMGEWRAYAMKRK